MRRIVRLHGIPNWGTDLYLINKHSVRFVNAAIKAYAAKTGPMVEVGIEGKPGLFKPTKVRTVHGVPQALVSGEWVNVRGVILQ